MRQNISKMEIQEQKNYYKLAALLLHGERLQGFTLDTDLSLYQEILSDQELTKIRQVFIPILRSDNYLNGNATRYFRNEISIDILREIYFGEGG